MTPLVLDICKLTDGVTVTEAVAVLLLATGSGSAVTPPGELSERATLAVLMKAVEVGVPALSTLTVKDSVWLVNGNSALIVQVPVLPDVVNVPTVVVGVGEAANARVGGNTSRYNTWKAARGPLLRATMVNVPVEPTTVGGVSVL